LTDSLRRDLLGAFGSFAAEDDRDRLAPPPKEMTVSLSRLLQEEGGDVAWWERGFGLQPRGKK
jgi:hypothetical protein